MADSRHITKASCVYAFDVKSIENISDVQHGSALLCGRCSTVESSLARFGCVPCDSYVRVGNAGLAELVNLRVGEFCGVVCGVGRECASLVLFNTYRLWTKLVLWHCLAGI